MTFWRSETKNSSFLLLRAVFRGGLPGAALSAVLLIVAPTAAAVETDRLWLPKSKIHLQPKLLATARIAETTERCEEVVSGQLNETQSNAQGAYFMITCRDQHRRTYSLGYWYPEQSSAPLLVREQKSNLPAVLPPSDNPVDSTHTTETQPAEDAVAGEAEEVVPAEVKNEQTPVADDEISAEDAAWLAGGTNEGEGINAEESLEENNGGKNGKTDEQSVDVEMRTPEMNAEVNKESDPSWGLGNWGDREWYELQEGESVPKVSRPSVALTLDESWALCEKKLRQKTHNMFDVELLNVDEARGEGLELDDTVSFIIPFNAKNPIGIALKYIAQCTVTLYRDVSINIAPRK